VPHLRIGVLGAAKIAERNMLPAIVATSGVQLVAIASRDLERASALCRRFGGEARSTYDEVLNDASIDAVYVPLPIGLHREWVGAALEAGKHVLSEKSLAGWYGDARELIELARERSLVLFENFMCEAHPQSLAVRDLVASGWLGIINQLSLAFGFPPFPADDQRNSLALQGGALNDAGAYCVDMAQFYLNATPFAVVATADSEGAEVDQRGSATLFFDDGAVAQLAYGFGFDYRNEARIWGSHGQVDIDRAFSIPADREPAVTLVRNTIRERIAVPAEDQFRRQLERFRDAVIRGLWAEELDRRQRHALVMEAIRRSAVDNRIVQLDEFDDWSRLVKPRSQDAR
jgi:NDP-hexose-3-ketoreductase